MKITSWLWVVVVAGCGGGSTSSPDAFVADAAPDTITVAITSPVGGASIRGTRAVEVKGTLAAAAPITSVDVKVGTTTVAAIFGEKAFTATVMVANNANTITVTAHDAIQGSGTASVDVDYPFVHFTDFPAATRVLGQTAADIGTQRTTDASTMKFAVGDPVMIGATLYVPVLGENRVLGYSAFPTTDNQAGDFVLGQATLADGVAAVGADGLDQPSDVDSDGTKLVASDHANNRVVVWNTAPSTTHVAADVVVGEPDFDTSTGGCEAARVKGPIDLTIASGRLIVADTNNNRVLIWNTIPTTNGAAADLVIGQADFTHCAGNDDNQDSVSDLGPTARTVRNPIGVWSDGTRLIVADSANNRLLIWKTFPTSSFTPADVVLGQPSFTTANPGLSATALASPQFIASNGNQLVVTDTNNNRVLVWDDVPTLSGRAPDHVIGQSTFLHGSANDDNQDDATDATPSARTLKAPRGLLLTATSLWVSDQSNNRALVYVP